ncbi:protein kinase domain-containing protein [Streptomyces sp. NBC_00588]|uniref:protein kinase domain-containing protein n=1 Tax=Streptomyces sp. NBC_00588 TaxID=2975784 RepID=UPI002E802056|nr:protein kinase [Streptomyces sp. NBC_00588]WUB35061.1 protein kinase [Streptomyces sp. NBC_00588]
MHDFAQGLRDLRAAAGSPPYRELSRRARYSHSALSDAAAGHRLPTLDVTLALVAACGGDVDAWRARWEELDAQLRATHPELLPGQGEPEDDAAGSPPREQGAEPLAGRQAPAGWDASSAEARAVIRRLTEAGEYGRATVAAEMCEGDAVRVYGVESAEAAGWAEIRADVARAAGEMGTATRWWLTAAKRRTARGVPDTSGAVAAARSAHWCWERVTDPVEARLLGADLVVLLSRLPGLDPRQLPAARSRLNSLANTPDPGAGASGTPPHSPTPDPSATASRTTARGSAAPASPSDGGGPTPAAPVPATDAASTPAPATPSVPTPPGAPATSPAHASPSPLRPIPEPSLPSPNPESSPPHSNPKTSLPHSNPESSPPHPNPESSPPHSNPKTSLPHPSPKTSLPHPNPEPLPSPAPTAVDPPVVEPLRKADPERVGAFRLLGRLGAGAMGEVFLGASASGRPVAVKVVRADFAQDAAFRRRFAAEVATARRVQGPYTPAEVDADADAERPWLATTYISGPSLAEVIRTSGPLQPGVVRALAAGIAEALAAIHGAGVLHRDLKPSNVLLDRDGPKVIDFGVARAADGTRLTETGVAVGTVPFMSPEQIDGRPLGPPSDVFSLGGLLTYAATGLTPFGEGNPGEVAGRIIQGPPDARALDIHDGALRELITRCLDKDPGRRPTPRQIIESSGNGRPHGNWLPAPLAARIARREHRVADVLKGVARRGRTRRSLKLVVPLAAALVLAVVLALTLHRGDATPRASASYGYETVFRNRPVALRDDEHEIDLMSGDVVTGSRYWTLSTDAGGDSKGGFSLQDATDAYVAGSGRITPAQCAADVARHPVEDEVHWSQVPAGSWFCLRWRLTGDIAVLRVSSTDTGSWGADLSLDYYRHSPPLSTPGSVPGPVGAGYRRLYAPRPLTLPGADSLIDLGRGRVASKGTWMLSTDAGGDSKGAYDLQDSSDAYISGQSPVSPARCAVGIAQHPVADQVRFPQVPAGTWFCVRDTLTHDIAVIQVLDKDDGDWSTTITVTAYRPTTAGGN